MTALLEGMLEETDPRAPRRGWRRQRIERLVVVAVALVTVVTAATAPFLEAGYVMLAGTLVGLLLGVGPSLSIIVRWPDPVVEVAFALGIGLGITLLSSAILVELKISLLLVIVVNAVLAVATLPIAWHRAGGPPAEPASSRPPAPGTAAAGSAGDGRAGAADAAPGAAPDPTDVTLSVPPPVLVKRPAGPAAAAVDLAATPGPVSPAEPGDSSHTAETAPVPALAAAEVPDDAPAPHSLRARLLQFGGLGLAVGAWWFDTRAADLELVGARGLLEVIGPGYLVALALISVVGASALVRRRLDHVVLAATAATGALVAYLYVSMATGVAGFGTVWVHVGFIEFIVNTGELAQGVDARFSWPGFFAAGAAIVHTANLVDAGGLAFVGPLWVTLSAFPGLFVIGRFVTRSSRLAWLGIYVYLVFNWFSQDYFAPQATALVLYLALLSVLLHQVQVSPLPALTGSWIRRALQATRRVPGRPPGVGAAGVLGREFLLLVLICAIVITHQLTPVVVMTATFVFALTGNTRHRMLALFTCVVFVAWFSWGAVDYWTGNLKNVVQDVGQFGRNVNSGLTDRLGATDPEYNAMQRLRIVWSAIYMLLAFVGGLGLLRRKHQPALVAGLVIAPFGLVGVQSYGGEVLFRSFVLAAPVLAPLAALGLVAIASGLGWLAHRAGRRPTGWTPVRRLVAGVVVAVLGFSAGLALTTTRGLNAGFERITQTEMEGAEAMLAVAPVGSTIAVMEPLGPGQRSRSTELKGIGLEVANCSVPQATWDDLIQDPTGWPDPVACLQTQLPDFIYVTQGQITMDSLRGGLEQDWGWNLMDRIAATGDFDVLYESSDTIVLVRARLAETGPTGLRDEEGGTSG